MTLVVEASGIEAVGSAGTAVFAVVVAAAHAVAAAAHVVVLAVAKVIGTLDLASMTNGCCMSGRESAGC